MDCVKNQREVLKPLIRLGAVLVVLAVLFGSCLLNHVAVEASIDTSSKSDSEPADNSKDKDKISGKIVDISKQSDDSVTKLKIEITGDSKSLHDVPYALLHEENPDFSDESIWSASNERTFTENGTVYGFVRQKDGTVTRLGSHRITGLPESEKILFDESALGVWTKDPQVVPFTLENFKTDIADDQIQGQIANGTVAIECVNGGKQSYIATVTPNEGKEVNAPLTISIEMQDAAGADTDSDPNADPDTDVAVAQRAAGTNKVEATTEKSVKIDHTAPTISLNSDLPTKWSNKQVALEFTLNDKGSLLDKDIVTKGKLKAYLEGRPDVNVTVEEVAETNFQSNAVKVKVTVKKKKNATINNPLVLEVPDALGNTAVYRSETPIRIDDQVPDISDVKITKVKDDGHKILTDGDTFKISFNIDDHDGSGVDESSFSKDNIKFKDAAVKSVKKVSDSGYEYQLKVGKGNDLSFDKDNAPVILSTFQIADKVGNQNATTGDVDSGYVYFAPLNDNNVVAKITSSNGTPTVARDGDVITVSLSATHPVNVDATVTKPEKAAIVWTKKNEVVDKDGVPTYYWEGTYQVDNKKDFDNGKFDIDVVVTDETGASVTKKSDGITYYLSLEDSIKSFTYVSSNPSDKLAKDGDKLSAAIEFTHPVQVSHATIAGKEVVFNPNADKTKWTAEYTVEKDIVADNTFIPLSLEISDTAGNDKIVKNIDSESSDPGAIRYYGEIKVAGPSLISDNAKSPATAVKDNNTLELSLSTQHPVKIASAKLFGQDVVMNDVNGDQMTWKASLVVEPGKYKDQSPVTFEIKTEQDDAGNDAVIMTEKDIDSGPIIYYAPITVTNLTMKSNNEKDGAKYAKNDDTIQVDFTTNHDAELSDLKIAGHKPKVEKADGADGSKQWKLTYTLKNGNVKNMGIVDFQMAVNDAAGNDAVTKSNTDSDITNQIQYFAPISAKTEFYSDGKNSGYAKNADIVTVNAKLSQPVQILNAYIGGRVTTNTGDGTNELKMSYQIPSKESSLKEGPLAINYNVVDVAGNTANITKANSEKQNQVIYDRTKPVVKSSSDFNGFLNKDISFIYSYSDTNLAKDGIFLLVNGAEKISEAEKNGIAPGATSFEHTEQIKLEDEYEMVAKVTDMAGNESTSSKTSITLDKTKPEISYNIDLDKSHTFKSGFIIAEHFNIKEDHVKEVLCTLTESSDAPEEWDIFEPIVKDGKKTMYLVVTDMAGNNSVPITYDFYIDGTAPKPIIEDVSKDQAKQLAAGENQNFQNRVEIQARLEKMHMGNEDPDKFVKLEVQDKKGNVVYDFLKTAEKVEENVFKQPIKQYGNYTLVVKAVDDVGNETEEIRYDFSFRDQTIVQKYYENKPLFYISIVFASVLMISAVVLVILKTVKKNA